MPLVGWPLDAAFVDSGVLVPSWLRSQPPPSLDNLFCSAQGWTSGFPLPTPFQDGDFWEHMWVQAMVRVHTQCQEHMTVEGHLF